jgi:hypothetical protein
VETLAKVFHPAISVSPEAEHAAMNAAKEIPVGRAVSA